MQLVPNTFSSPAVRRGRPPLSPEARSEARERRRFEQDLRAATEQQSFVLHYQPRLALRSGRVVAAEALIRWPHSRRGLVPPASFIPFAEETGLITPIGGWVLRHAGAEAATWPEEIGLSVNVSARQLHDGALARQVASALEDGRLPPERLELELTESMLVQVSEETLLTLSAIRDLGVGIALDDFGTGYASLAMLRRLPLTVMKIDRSLVAGVTTDREDRAIVRAVVATGRAIGLTVVAEGIETEAQRDFLADIDCDQGQGYLFSRPVPPSELQRSFGPTLTRQ